MKTLIALFVLLIAAVAAPAPAKPSDNAQTPTFRARTDLVQVPVIVTKGGKHVSGLTKNDFTVLEEGSPKPIAFFEEVKAENHGLKHVATPAGTYTNAIAGVDGPTALTVIVLDLVNTPYLAQANSRLQVVEFLRHSAHNGIPIMLASIHRDGLRVLHQFTTSPEVLIAALGKTKSTLEGSHLSTQDAGFISEMKGDFDISNVTDVTKETADIDESFTHNTADMLKSAMAIDQERKAELTLIAMNQLIRAIGAIPGRKSMLWTSGGFICDPGQTLSGFHQDLVDKCNAAWRLLSANNIAVYPINPTQTENPGFVSPTFSTPVHNAPRGMPQQLIAESFAKYTGGRVCTFRNDDSCYREALEDSSQYYLLGYYASPAEKPKWRKLAVKVDTPGVSIRARNGYMAADSAKGSEDQRKNDVALAIISPIDYTGVPMTVKWMGASAANDKRQFRFQIAVPARSLQIDEGDENHLKLTIIAFAMNAKGERVGDVTKDINGHIADKNLALLRQQGFGYTDVLEVPPGEFTVKFIVRDDLSGKMGTVTAPTPKLSGS